MISPLFRWPKLVCHYIPTWPHSKSWGYGPSGGLGLVVFILVILLLLGKI
ncbi:DUF3309 domain-containing protein [Shewanella baltica]|nr:DUF3309 domain-containing protein [Shewanella baltica]MCS6257342.1 DUF3309 domain-containing protein [Shewanella baltica]